MKNLRIAAVLLFATATITAQDLTIEEVPSNLQTTFTDSFKNTTDVEWEKKGDLFKVEFEINKMDHDVWYDAEGNVVKSKIEISQNELPSTIASAVKTKYPEYKLDSIEVYEDATSKTYKVEIEKGWSMERKLVFEASGTLLSDIED